jgi:hypothetical protein
MYASQVQAQQMYPEVIQAIRQLTGGGDVVFSDERTLGLHPIDHPFD